LELEAAISAYGLQKPLEEGGKVYAVDTNSGFLEFIVSSAKERGLDDVETILASEGDLAVPGKALCATCATI